MKKTVNFSTLIALSISFLCLMSSCDKNPTLEEKANIIIKTDKFKAERLSFSFAAISDDVYIDWGEGKQIAADFVKTENAIGRKYNWQINRSRIKGQTIKIYGTLIAFLCPDNRISELELVNCPELKFLDCSKNRLTTLDVSKCKNLELLYFSNNKMADIDLSNNKNLQILFCDQNEIEKLDISKQEKLEILNCSFTKLTELDFSNSPKLVELHCKKTAINVSDEEKEKHPKLKIFK